MLMYALKEIEIEQIWVIVIIDKQCDKKREIKRKRNFRQICSNIIIQNCEHPSKPYRERNRREQNDKCET